MCWGLAHAYQAAIDTTINLVTDPAATPSPVTDPTATPTPMMDPAAAPVPAPAAAPSPVAGSEKRAVAVQVAPVEKVKKWYRDSGRLERRESSAKSRYRDNDDAGPSGILEEEDEDAEKSTVTTRNLYERELRGV